MQTNPAEGCTGDIFDMTEVFIKNMMSNREQQGMLVCDGFHVEYTTNKTEPVSPIAVFNTKK